MTEDKARDRVESGDSGRKRNAVILPQKPAAARMDFFNGLLDPANSFRSRLPRVAKSGPSFQVNGHSTATFSPVSSAFRMASATATAATMSSAQGMRPARADHFFDVFEDHSRPLAGIEVVENQALDGALGAEYVSEHLREAEVGDAGDRAGPSARRTTSHAYRSE